MPFFRFRFVIVIISVILSAGILVWGIFNMPGKPGGKYAALVFDEAVPDREIREFLENNGVTGLFSESGQYVLLDVFDTVEYIPLDEYETRVLSFDPRNDGYAQRLRSMFVRDGKRYIYLPVSGIRKAVASFPDDFSYAIEMEKSNTPPVFLLILFGISACVFFIVKPLRLALSPYSACLIPCLPALVPFALGGTAGFAIIALFAGYAVFLAQVFYERQFPRSQFYSMYRRRIPFPVLFLFSFLFLAGCGLPAFFSDLSYWFILAVVSLFCGIFFISLRLVIVSGRPEFWKFSLLYRDTGRRRFMPVQIMGRRESGLLFPFAMIPFAVIALVPVFLDVKTPDLPNVNLLPPNPVTETEWQNHFYFQSGFSTRSLFDDDSGNTYLIEYTLQDGLIVPVYSGNEQAVKPVVPPFPLGELFTESPVHSGAIRSNPVKKRF